MAMGLRSLTMGITTRANTKLEDFMGRASMPGKTVHAMMVISWRAGAKGWADGGPVIGSLMYT